MSWTGQGGSNAKPDSGLADMVAAARSWLLLLCSAVPGSEAEGRVAAALEPEGRAAAVFDLYGLLGLATSLGTTPGNSWAILDRFETLEARWKGEDPRLLITIAAAGRHDAERRASLFLRRHGSRWLLRDIWPTGRLALSLQTDDVPDAVRACFRGRPSFPVRTWSLRDDVERLLAPRVHGWGIHRAALGLRLWRDYRRKVRSPAGRPETLAAAATYAMVRIACFDFRQAEVAAAYGVSPAALAHRFPEIRDALRLKQFDLRYCDDRPGTAIEEAMLARGLGCIPELPL